MITDESSGQRVAILLSTFNGERFLQEQLDSLLAQTHRDWVLFWRDDGSCDRTRTVLRRFAAGVGACRCVEAGPPERLGPTGSFLCLLRAAIPGGYDAFAFADQDDVWLPEKLERAVRSLRQVRADAPALYCARQVYVDEQLGRLGLSCIVRPAGFPAALTQNIATGCTMLMNRSAAALVAASRPPSASYHDWWAYLMVAAVGGTVLTDDEPAVLYRQHDGNLVGAPLSLARRSVAALRRGPRVFMTVFRQQVLALAAQPDLITKASHEQVLTVADALRGGFFARARALRRTGGLLRQTWPETLIFRLWFMLG